MPTYLDFSVLCVAALVTALVAIWWAGTSTAEVKAVALPAEDPVSLLFDDGILHHATGTATSRLAMHPGHHFWEDLRDRLLGRFPDFPDLPVDGKAGQVTLRAMGDDGPEEALIHWRGSLCWVTLTTPLGPQSAPPASGELESLRRVSQTAPYPVWEETKEGVVTWHNQAYRTMFQDVHGQAPDAAKPLFTNDDPSRPERVYVTHQNGKRGWYEQTAVPSGGKTIYHACGIAAVVSAEETQRNFVQTLAKTFAHLSAGLAIFDRNKQLVLFNPALVDLTGLPAQFLSARPDMLSFFDRLRENRKMPEPKNYLNWRDEIMDVIAAASDGRYQETWTLETGQTYSVQGRPHPDGATAFLIEDISAEMTLTRNFRAELEQAQIVLDTVDDAMAIFSPAGILTFSNAAYQTLWQIKPDTAFADMTLQDCASIWKNRARSDADIIAIDRFLSELGVQEPQDMTLRLGDMTVFRCQMMPIPSGATLIRFHPIQEPVKRAKQQRQTT